MKDSLHGVAFLLFSWLLMSAHLPAATFDFPPLPELSEPDPTATTKVTPVAKAPLALETDIFKEFRECLERALAAHDPAAIAALYQTNHASAAVTRIDLERWKPAIENKGPIKTSLFFKALHLLPPTARTHWTDVAHRMTRQPVTGILLIETDLTPQFRMLVPVTTVEDRLMILVSEKLR